jgi:hypothetical protein
VGSKRLFICLTVVAAVFGLRAADAQVALSSASLSTIIQTQGALRQSMPLLRVALAEEPPMVFFVASGPANACGPGCSKWIAAEGDFDPDAASRFQAFVRKAGNRNLPVHFNSEGGVIGQARLVGRILRQYKMRATIGKTVPQECSGDTEEPACRKVMRASAVVNSQLLTIAAKCYSACFYALVGASIRDVPEGARLGIHASKPTAVSIAIEKAGGRTHEQFKNDRKRYLVDMGVDPAAADLSEQFPSETMHILTREELSRFRIERRISR